MTKEDKQAAEQPTEESQTTIRWDGSKMRSTYANVCNVSSSREEVTLLFGTNQNWHAGQKELTVELSDRITLNPYAAKRMAVLLMNTMTEYEKRFGELKLELPEKKDK
ncbi:DUF3467 domain-containing protein [Desulfuromonas acetoxidans]|uniref:DUF3467 domain-containing protein n=1 Tax=Desulfuromonas acetoxidans (strain DSM 684 / 11070) TaxID=281689 RepID=Q1JX38_DESA6|nr:DUF3467 domain-containing protein [Desulfuromonas acetoxidans]EAT14824.1 hypothetical protein Dace_0963 [Desulfuromonas acetoxidans DSM 684]MBF0646572.1 DUF3467 domain-containing protein [Desulfuromonas acetoxidans]NVD26252.1 DUF3467 domain-containing protein [Desulfuromonas acetoxidans]NVE18093.1 DUF3467 domain-containing protein [Desulfuromonas acetoxidans]